MTNPPTLAVPDGGGEEQHDGEAPGHVVDTAAGGGGLPGRQPRPRPAHQQPGLQLGGQHAQPVQHRSLQEISSIVFS